MNYNKLLEGKKCVISAGTCGMGFSIASLFVKHGATVAICGRATDGEEAAEALREYNPDCFFVQCDMSDLKQVENFANTIIDRFGNIDVIVNNVGINRKELVKDIKEENYNLVMNTNINSALLLTKKLIPYMNKKGSIINTSSMNSIAVSPTTGSYAISKGGINSFTKVLAAELGKYSIRANAICAGWVATSDIKSSIDAIGKENAYEYLEGMQNTAPLISPGKASDVASHALFLASDMSSYITGYIMYSDGASIRQGHYFNYDNPVETTEIKKQHYDKILSEFDEII